MPDLDPGSTALILIDLQKGIIGRSLAPHSGDEVLKTSRTLAETFRAAGAPVVLVRVAFAPDFVDAPPHDVDEPFQGPPGGIPAAWSELVDGLAQPSDIIVLKRQWGAFYGTDLDLHLRRRGVKTIVLGGVATNFGVESTARAAWEHGYNVVLAEDATASTAADLHAFAIKHVFPRISRVVASADIRLTAAR